MSLVEQQELENEYVMHTFGRKPVDLVRGEGMYAYDDQGKAYLDFLSGIGVNCLGHCHPVVANAIKEQAEKLIHVSNYYYIEGRGQLAKMLSDMLNACVPADQQTPWKSFFSNSGAESNECAIKLARLWGKQHGLGQTVVVLQKSFHGRTLATLAATAQPVKQEAFQPLPAGFVPTPQNDCEALRDLFAKLGTEICAVMVEPIQGESGVNPCTAEFLACARELLDAQQGVLIADEVQCGIFRCGTYPFGFQHLGVTPDIVSMAKGIGGGFPMGACAAREEVAAVFEPGIHGSTFGGSNLAIATSLAVLSELTQGGYAESVAEVGAYFREKLAELPQVSEVRGLGLMVGADLVDELNAPQVMSQALEAGLIINATGPHTLRFLPSLIVTKADVDICIEKLVSLL